MFQYNIRPDSDIPIYRQLVDQINAEIRSGALKVGTQLPTVREMASQLNLSCGTVKRVYDRLQEMGDIEMTRRRGTFVKYVRTDTDSRKLQAMTAIDHMIRQLSDLNFSPSEIHIFVSLKMREWGMKWSGIRIALVTDCIDFASGFEEQLNQIGNVNVVIWKLKQVREYPYNLDEQSDVILASPEDAQKLETILPNRSKLVKVAFRADPKDVYELAQATGKRIAILCQDKSFVQLVRSFLPSEAQALLKYALIDDAERCAAILADCDCIMATESTQALLNAGISEMMQARFRTQLLRFGYSIDEGSMIYLEERIGRIREERQLQPGALQLGNIPPHL